MERKHYLDEIQNLFKNHAVVALLGPRQSGKTTLAQQFVAERSQVHYFDLEDPEDLAKLAEPKLTLQDLQGLIVIDEIQRAPVLFPLLRVLVDRAKGKQRYLILGSASRELIQKSSESLAGRIAYLEITPFSFEEVPDEQKLWLRGGFPLSYLAEDNALSFSWRQHYITTFLERDIPALGIRIAPQQLRRFWMMLAHSHGNLFNATELGRSLQTSGTTVKHYLDILTGVFMIRSLQPWFENIKKRQVKSPKIYLRDSGLLHNLLNIQDQSVLLGHPKLGASWEGFAVEQVIRLRRARDVDCYFWAIHAQAELDLLIVEGSQKHGFEFKYTAQPRVTKSMLTAMDVLQLDSLSVIYPGTGDFPLHESGIRAIGLDAFS